MPHADIPQLLGRVLSGTKYGVQVSQLVGATVPCALANMQTDLVVACSKRVASSVWAPKWR